MLGDPSQRLTGLHARLVVVLRLLHVVEERLESLVVTPLGQAVRRAHADGAQGHAQDGDAAHVEASHRDVELFGTRRECLLEHAVAALVLEPADVTHGALSDDPLFGHGRLLALFGQRHVGVRPLAQGFQILGRLHGGQGAQAVGVRRGLLVDPEDDRVFGLLGDLLALLGVQHG